MIVAFAAIAAAALLQSGAASGNKSRPSTYVGRLGFHVHFAASSAVEAERGMRALRAAGVTWVRDDIDWRYVEPRPGVFDWTRGDMLMTAAAKARVHVLGILAYAPRWAQTDPDVPYSPPRDLGDYIRYVKYVIWRYGPGGDFWRVHPGLRPMPLRAVELWNEPWAWWFWRPEPDPTDYARLAHAGAVAIRTIAPKTTILLSGDVWGFRRDGSGPPFLTAVLRADPSLKKLVDGYSVHAYSGASPPGSRRAEQRFAFARIALTTLAAKQFRAAKPIWLTEYGWSTAPATAHAVTESQQARYLVQATKLAFRRYHVAKAFVYDYSRSNGAQGDLDDNYGMMRADGSYKPAWRAITRLLRRR
jgi:hypothetical protein